MRTLIVICLTASVASAHGLYVKPTVSPEAIHVVAMFDDDTPAANAKVTILNASGEVLASGMTNEKGEVGFPRPAVMEGCKVRVDAGDGHARTVLLPREGEAPADSPNKIWLTAAGLGIIAIVALVLRYFWPKSRPPESHSEKSSPL